MGHRQKLLTVLMTTSHFNLIGTDISKIMGIKGADLNARKHDGNRKVITC